MKLINEWLFHRMSPCFKFKWLILMSLGRIEFSAEQTTFVQLLSDTRRGGVLPSRQAVSYLTSTEICFGFVAALFGSVIVRIPLSQAA